MSSIPCTIRAGGAGSNRRAEDARQSPRFIVVGDAQHSQVGYNADVAVPYYLPVAGTLTLFTDTIKAYAWALLWQGDVPSTLAAAHTALDRTAGTYVLFSVPTSGGLGQLMAVEQAQYPTLAGTLDLLGQQTVYPALVTRYQPRTPIGCPFWTKSAADPTVRWIAGNGVDGWSGDGGDPRAAKIAIGWSITKGPDGAYYIGTAGSVRKVTCHQITTVAGTGTGGHTGDGPATSTPVGVVRGVVFDAAGVLWIADLDGSENLINNPDYAALAMPNTGTGGSQFKMLNTIPPAPPPGYGGFYAESGFINHNTPYNTLRSVDLVANTLTSTNLTYLAPLFTQSDGVNPIHWVLSQGRGLTIGSDGTLYLTVGVDILQGFLDFDFTGIPFTNSMNGRIEALCAVPPARTSVSVLAIKSGQTHEPFGSSPLISSSGYPVSNPGSPWVTPGGDVYWPNMFGFFVTDTTLQKRTAGGTFSTVGSGTFQGGAVAVDGAGNVYVADTVHHCIRRKDAITGVEKVICGVPGVPGGGPVGLPGPATHIQSPVSIHVTPEGIVTFGDFSNRILQLGGNS